MYLMQKRYFVWDTSAYQRTNVISGDNKWQYIGEVPWVVLGTVLELLTTDKAKRGHGGRSNGYLSSEPRGTRSRR